MSDGPDVRASDRERDRTAALLSAHWSDGRLDLAELDRRTEAAYAATTRGEPAAGGPGGVAGRPAGRHRRAAGSPHADAGPAAAPAAARLRAVPRGDRGRR